MMITLVYPAVAGERSDDQSARRVLPTIAIGHKESARTIRTRVAGWQTPVAAIGALAEIGFVQ